MYVCMYVCIILNGSQQSTSLSKFIEIPAAVTSHIILACSFKTTFLSFFFSRN